MTNEELVALVQEGVSITDNMTMLYEQNKGFIYSIVRKFGYITYVSDSCHYTGITEIEDLMNESYFGLVKAVEGYNPAAGASFLSYAAHWIKQSIRRYIENSGGIIRIPVHTQQKIYQYNKVSSHYLSTYNRMPTPDEYCQCMDIGKKTLVNLERTMRISTVSMDAPLETESQFRTQLVDAGDTEIVVTDRMLIKQLWDEIERLFGSNREYQVLMYRYKGSMSLEGTGKKIGVSRDAVRQDESKALKRLKVNRNIQEIAQCLGHGIPRRINYTSNTLATKTL